MFDTKLFMLLATGALLVLNGLISGELPYGASIVVRAEAPNTPPGPDQAGFGSGDEELDSSDRPDTRA